jgi:hypothetical protein
VYITAPLPGPLFLFVYLYTVMLHSVYWSSPGVNAALVTLCD